MSRITVGSVVVCTRRPGMDDNGHPFQRPEVGEIYTITMIYKMRYGFGCMLDGLDPKPYRGYILKMVDNTKFPDMPLGMYFEPVQMVDLKRYNSVGASQDGERHYDMEDV